MYIENDQVIVENVLREELNQGCLAASGLTHYYHGDSGLHPKINDAHFEEVICGHHITIILDRKFVVVSSEHLQEILKLNICHLGEIWNLNLVIGDQLSNLWSLFVIPDALIDEDEHLYVFGDLYGVFVH